MKILLTGASGFIGQYLVHELSRHEIDYIVLGGTPTDFANHEAIDLLSCDDFSAVMEKANATHLIHLAWFAKHGEFWNSQQNFHWLKVTSEIVDAFCKHGGQHVTISGTCAEYDWNYGYCVEGITPINPVSTYGVCKDATRRIAEITCKKYDVELAWLRIFFPYGVGESENRLIPSLFRYYSGQIDAFGINSETYRDFLHIRDVVHAIYLCSTKHATGIFNVSSGDPVSLRTIVEKIAAIYERDPSEILSVNTERVNDPKLIVGANEKLLSLGWENNISLDDGLFRYSKYGNFKDAI